MLLLLAVLLLFNKAELQIRFLAQCNNVYNYKYMVAPPTKTYISKNLVVSNS
jgi:hypothetical protein